MIRRQTCLTLRPRVQSLECWRRQCAPWLKTCDPFSISWSNVFNCGDFHWGRPAESSNASQYTCSRRGWRKCSIRIGRFWQLNAQKYRLICWFDAILVSWAIIVLSIIESWESRTGWSWSPGQTGPRSCRGSRAGICLWAKKLHCVGHLFNGIRGGRRICLGNITRLLRPKYLQLRAEG